MVFSRLLEGKSYSYICLGSFLWCFYGLFYGRLLVILGFAEEVGPFLKAAEVTLTRKQAQRWGIATWLFVREGGICLGVGFLAFGACLKCLKWYFSRLLLGVQKQ